MASRLVRSVFWLVACGSVSYGLLVFTTPSEKEIQQRRKELLTAKEREQYLSKNKQFMNVLISASDSNKPIYRLNKEELDKELKK